MGTYSDYAKVIINSMVISTLNPSSNPGPSATLPINSQVISRLKINLLNNCTGVSRGCIIRYFEEWRGWRSGENAICFIG